MGTEEDKEDATEKVEEKTTDTTPPATATVDFSALMTGLNNVMEGLAALPEKVLSSVREGTKPAEEPKVTEPEKVKEPESVKPAQSDKKEHFWFRKFGA